MSKQIYISGALTNGDCKSFYESIGEAVRKSGFIPYIPHIQTEAEKDPNGNPKEVYFEDIKQIEKSEVLIAYIGRPSLGVGQEIERANYRKIPIILVYHEEDKVSRMPLGTPMVYKIIKYATEREALEMLEKTLKEYYKWRK